MPEVERADGWADACAKISKPISLIKQKSRRLRWHETMRAALGNGQVAIFQGTYRVQSRPNGSGEDATLHLDVQSANGRVIADIFTCRKSVCPFSTSSVQKFFSFCGEDDSPAISRNHRPDHLSILSAVFLSLVLVIIFLAVSKTRGAARRG